MALLDSVLEVRDTSKSGGGGNYLNPSSIDKDQTVRITFLGNKSLGGYECWVTKEGKRFSMKFKTEPTREDLAERADEEGVELTGDEKPKGFYAFFIWNYEEEAVQVFQFSQAGLIDPIISNLSDDEISAGAVHVRLQADQLSKWTSATTWLVSPANVARTRSTSRSSCFR